MKDYIFDAERQSYKESLEEADARETTGGVIATLFLYGLMVGVLIVAFWRGGCCG